MRKIIHAYLWAAVVTVQAPVVQAQDAESPGLAVEEIVVTAQRREQSMQEVPISLEAVSGFELKEQGFRTMDDFAEFSPSVEIDSRVQDQDISIRGIGTTGNNLTLEQGAPTFVDGIHFGRTSMIKSAFMDLERIEILRGPQPVYFGQNATAGAFSLITRKPGAEWQGNITAEAGNFGRRSIEGGVGGPLSDTLGIRVAGKYDRLEGFLTDVITREKFPARRDAAGRITLSWRPTDRFRSTFKAESAKSYTGSEAIAACLGAGSDVPRDPAIGIDALIKGRTSFDDIYHLQELSACGSNPTFDGLGIKTPAEYFDIPPDITQEDSRGTGFIDTRDVVRRVRMEEYGRDLSGFDEFETYNSYLDLSFTLANEIEISSLTGYVDYSRTYNRNNSNSPFLGNMRQRSEDLTQWSQEFRISSPLGGWVEWMAGAYWQNYDLDLVSDNFRGNLRRPRRLNFATEDSEWLSAFATVTFNFLDDRASLDIGGRFTEVEKEGSIIGYGALWVFDEPAAEGGSIAVTTREGTPGFALPWRSRKIPSNWHTAIGMTDVDATIRRKPGPYQDTFSATEFDPQITFRYRPTDDVSTYARFAQAFKSGGFNTGVGTLSDEEDFMLDPELAESWEIGVKGAFWDGRARADLSLFWMEVEDLQLATTVVDTQGDGALGSESTNAGKQRVRGIEFLVDTVITQNLRARLSGALMDGEMIEFKGAGCTDVEFADADNGPCISEEESIALVGSDDLEGTIDRSGSEAPRTPDWKFALKLDYSRPILENHVASAGMNLSYSDGYITNVEDFDLVQKAGRHTDMNLNVGFGDYDGRWRVSAWVRNFFEVQEEYNRAFDLEAEGIVTDNMSPSNFRTYGLQVEYNYN